jgi:hypothetical protein
LYEPTYPLVRDFDGAGVEIGGAGAPWQAVAFQFRPQRSTPLSAIQILLTCLEPEDGGAGCDFLVELREDENGLPGREMALQPTPRFYREQLYWISVAILSGARGQWDYLAFVEELRGRMAFLSSQAGGGGALGGVAGEEEQATLAGKDQAHATSHWCARVGGSGRRGVASTARGDSF